MYRIIQIYEYVKARELICGNSKEVDVVARIIRKFFVQKDRALSVEVPG